MKASGRLKWAAFASLALVALIAGYELSGAGQEPPVSGSVQEFKPAGAAAPAPQASFTDLAGKPVSLADLKGRIVVLNVWATWCPPCVKEMPSLEALAKTLDPGKVALLAVSEDLTAGSVVEPFLAGHGLSALAVDLDPQNVLLRAFHLRGLPTTLILDGEGRELGRIEGGTDWSTPEAKALIEFYVRAKAAREMPATSRV